MNGQAGKFGLVNPGHPSKIASICLVLGTIEKKILSQAKKKLEAIKWGVGSYVTPP